MILRVSRLNIREILIYLSFIYVTVYVFSRKGISLISYICLVLTLNYFLLTGFKGD